MITIYRTGSEWEAAAERNIEITTAYARMYLRAPHVYRWAGMAALTSASVGRAMLMLRAARRTGAGLAIGLWGGEVERTLRLLGRGNVAVYDDIFWQHTAYDAGGLAAIEAAHREGRIDDQLRDGWRSIDAGRRNGDAEAVWHGNRCLLEFEQRVVLQRAVYDQEQSLWRRLAGWMPSPLPLHAETFETWSRNGNPARFEDRWAWIEHSLLPRYRSLAEHDAGRLRWSIDALAVGRSALLPMPLYTRRTATAAA